MEKQSFKLRNLARIDVSDLSSTSSEDYAWKKDVIETHFDTTRLWRRVIEDSRTSRTRCEKSWDEARKVINIWNDYEDRFKQSVHNLSIRIEEFDKAEAERKSKEEALERKRNKIARSTEISRWRMRQKYVKQPTLPSFRIL